MSSWRALLLRIGDKCAEYGGSTDFKEHTDTCYGALLRELDYAPEDILTFLLQCVDELPHKIPFYATVIGLLNLDNEGVVKQIVETTQRNLQTALNSESCDKIRILMRFLTSLMCSKVLQPASLVVVFETFLSSAATTVDEENGNPSWQARGDFYITCILSSLPWGGAELIEQVPEEIERVMVGIEAYLSIRKRADDVGFSAFEFDDQREKPIEEKDFLEDLWDRVKVLSNNGWKVDSVPRPHLSFEAQLITGKSYDFGSISCPEQPAPPAILSGITRGKQRHEAELKYPRRLRRLNIFPENKIEDLQPIDRFVMEEYLLDVLLFFNGCRKECALYMVGLPVPFRYEYLMAETIFSQLLLLPHPPFKPIYYTLVIIDLCKALPGAFPAVVAGAVRALFERIADLDMECRIRLILWFSHHLSNFQFFWPWEEWAYVLDLPKWAPQRVFVQEVLEREVRLSYWDKTKQSIEKAPELEELLPPKVGASFKYGAEEGIERTEEHDLSSELSSLVKGRQVARELILWIDEKITQVHGSKIALEVTVQTLLDIGSKSFTHLITVLERYGNVIGKLCPDQDNQLMLLDQIGSYWKNSAQMTAITIDRMMGYRLISNLAIVRWVFSPANVDQFHTSDRPWEILRNAISKTYNRISDLRKEISVVKKNIVSAEESVFKAKAELDAADEKLTLVNGEPIQGEPPMRMRRLQSYLDKAKEEEVTVRESLEVKEALLARALEENEALFISLYKSFLDVLKERLPRASVDVTMRGLRFGHTDAMSVDSEEPSAMDVDNGRPNKSSRANGARSDDSYNIGEKEQWCLSTLGYVKTFSRQYATEIWPHIEKLDAEVFTEDMHPLFRQAVYSGLRRPLYES